MLLYFVLLLACVSRCHMMSTNQKQPHLQCRYCRIPSTMVRGQQLMTVLTINYVINKTNFKKFSQKIYHMLYVLSMHKKQLTTLSLNTIILFMHLPFLTRMAECIKSYVKSKNFFFFFFKYGANSLLSNVAPTNVWI